MVATEKEILSLLKQNMNLGFTRLVNTYQEKIYWHIRRLVYSHDDANDIAQNTFVKAYQNIQKFRGESKLYSWLYRIATNEAINFLQQKARHNNTSIEEYTLQLANQLSGDVFFDGDKAELTLQKAIAKLPEKQRLVFQLKYYDDLKYDDISVILQTSVGALKASYHHATQKIKAQIESSH